MKHLKRSNDQPKTQREHVRLVVPTLQLPPGDTLDGESNLQKMPMRMTRSVLDFQKEFSTRVIMSLKLRIALELQQA